MSEPAFCRECGFEAVACICERYGEDDDYGIDDGPGDQFDEATENCSGWFEEGSGRFICGAVGSEDCDCCPCYDWLGKTSEEIDAEELP